MRRFEDSWARTISGVDEGVFGWIALNYMSGTLLAGQGAGGAAVNGTLGALDLGGSSLEVAFAANSAVPAADQGALPARAGRGKECALTPPWLLCAVNVSVLGTTYSLYTHVHHHYGLNDAFDRGVTLLLLEQQQAGAGAVGTLPGDAGSGGQQADDIHNKQAARHAAAAVSDDSDRGVAPRRDLLEVPAALLWRPDRPALGSSAHTAAAAALRRQLELDWRANARPRGPRQLAAAAAPAPPRVLHPCLHDGYVHRYQRLLIADQAPTPREVELEGRRARVLCSLLRSALFTRECATLNMISTPARRLDYAACVALAQQVVNATAPCSSSLCALGAPRPRMGDQRFAALTGFYVVYHFLGLDSRAGLPALQQASGELVRACLHGCALRAQHWCCPPPPPARAQAGSRHCAKSWAEVASEYEGEVHLEHYCFRALFVELLLSQGLGLADRQLHIGALGCNVLLPARGRDSVMDVTRHGRRVSAWRVQGARMWGGRWARPWPRAIAWRV